MNWLERWHAWWTAPRAHVKHDENLEAHTDPARVHEEAPFTEPVELEITDVFDLHTIPPRQVKAVVAEYLFQARSRNFAVVRLIHGKGIGVQRETVRAVLSRTPFVIEYHDAPPAAGGWGATIARLQTGPHISESEIGQLE